MIIGIDASLACREQPTGVELYTFHIITHLVKIIPSDVEVRLYSDREFSQDFKKHIPSHWKLTVLSWPPRFLWTQVRLSFELFVRPPDIFFTPGHVQPIVHPKASVMTVHDVAAWRFPRAYSLFNRVYTLGRTLKAYHTNPVMIVPSIFTKYELEKLAQERNVQQKVEVAVIPHGFEKKTHVFQESVGDIFGRFFFTSQTPYVICIGRIEYKKNIDTIIHSFENLKKNNSELVSLKLVLAGKHGYGYENIKEIINKSLYRDDIVEIGWLTEAERHVLLTHARALVFASRYEGFGFPILEACAAGTPVITSRGLGLEEVGGDLPIYVDPTDAGAISRAMQEVITLSETKRVEYKKLSIAHCAQFSWDECARQTYGALIRAYAIVNQRENMI